MSPSAPPTEREGPLRRVGDQRAVVGTEVADGVLARLGSLRVRAGIPCDALERQVESLEEGGVLNDGGGSEPIVELAEAEELGELVLEALARGHNHMLVQVLAEDGRIVAGVEDEVRSGMHHSICAREPE